MTCPTCGSTYPNVRILADPNSPDPMPCENDWHAVTGQPCHQIAPDGPAPAEGSSEPIEDFDPSTGGLDPAEGDDDDEPDDLADDAGEPDLGALPPATDDPREAAEGAVIDPSEPAAEALPDDPFGPEYTQGGASYVE